MAPALSTSSGYLRGAVCIVGIYGSFLVWGFLQERITSFRSKEGVRFTFTAALNLVFYATAALFAAIGMALFPEDKEERAKACMAQQENCSEEVASKRWAALSPADKKIWRARSEEVGSHLDWCKVNLSNTCASGLGYASLQFISFPVHILAKSSKLIPVMAMGVFINGKKHSLGEYLAVLAITSGIIIFSFGKKGSKGEQHGATSIGLILVLMNLCCDGFTNATQDRINQKYKLPYLQMMLYMNAPSCLLLLVFLFNPINGSGPDAIRFVTENPSLIWDILGFSVMGAVGQNFIFFTIKEFGSLTCQTITLTRKAVQILLSVILFGHTISTIQWVGCGIVFLGLGGNMYSKELSKRARTKTEATKEIKSE